MIAVDTPALMAVVLGEAEADACIAVLERENALLISAAAAKGRHAAADDAALDSFGEVDPVDWSIETVRASMRKQY